MAFQDREYYREGSQSVYITSMVIKLIIINAVVFLVDALLLGGRLRLILGVHADTIVQPLYWWQFLTAGFEHDPNNISHVLFNMVGLYCFGMPLENRYGRREFLRFYLVAVVLGFIVWSAVHHFADRLDPRVACFGASGGVTATVILFCLLYPRATILANFIFPIPAWLFGIIIVGSNVLSSAGSTHAAGGPAVAYDVHLVGAAVALAYWYFGWNFGRLPGMDEFQRLIKAPKRWFKARSRPEIKVHDPEQYYEDLDAEADRLLEKVNQHGMSSLNERERRILEDYSRRTRQKLR